MVLHKGIECRASGIAGHGLYAIEPIKKGETLWVPDPDEKEKFWHTMDEILTWSKEEQAHFLNSAYLVGPNIYNGMRSVFDVEVKSLGLVRHINTLAGVRIGQETDKGEYMNHSCDPNCVFVGDDLCIAFKDIAVGDEVTYDYATSETPASSHPPFKCACGAKCCRGVVSGNDCMLPEVRAKYAGHFTTTVEAFHAEMDAKKA